MTQVELRTDVDGLVDDLADVDRETFSAPGYDADPNDIAWFRDEQLLKHAPRKGFRIAIAHEDGKLVGFAYGYTGEVGQWWTDRMLRLAPPDVHPWLGGQRAVRLVEEAPPHLGHAADRRVGRSTPRN